MNKSKVSFKRVYLIYLGILVLLMAAAVFYVYRLLCRYEASQPERQEKQAERQREERIPVDQQRRTADLAGRLIVESRHPDHPQQQKRR